MTKHEGSGILTLETKVVASKNQVSCDLAGEAAILNLKNSTYYGLDSVGARIWTLLQTPTTVAALRDAIVSEYEVTPTQAECDIVGLLAELKEASLVEISG